MAASYDAILTWRWLEAAAEADKHVVKAAANEAVLRRHLVWRVQNEKSDFFKLYRSLRFFFLLPKGVLEEPPSSGIRFCRARRSSFRVMRF